VSCSELQCIAEYSRRSLRRERDFLSLDCVAVSCSELQRVAASCRM